MGSPIDKILDAHWCMVTGQHPIYESMTTDEVKQALKELLLLEAVDVRPQNTSAWDAATRAGVVFEAIPIETINRLFKDKE